jgi:hypothetical protein
VADGLASKDPGSVPADGLASKTLTTILQMLAKVWVSEKRCDGLASARLPDAEGRFTAQAQRQTYILAIIVRLAAAQGISTAA